MKDRLSGKVPRHLLMMATLLAAMGMSSTGRAGTILFSPDGTNASTEAIASFVLAAGNSLSLGSVPLPMAGSGTVLPLLYQSTIAGFQDDNGDLLPNTPGLNSTFQLSIVLRFNEVVVTNTGMPGQVTFALANNQAGSFVEIYYNNTPATFANSLTGTGFNSGQLIFQGTPSATLLNNGNFSFTSGQGNGALDQRGTDNYPGITTLTGSGSALVGSFADLQNGNFFRTAVSTLTLNGDLKLPYTETNPSALFDPTRNGTGLGAPGAPPIQVGAPSTGGVNGLTGPNFIFQTTGTGSFELAAVPEPATIGTALMGVAGLAFGLVRSRRRKDVSVA